MENPPRSRVIDLFRFFGILLGGEVEIQSGNSRKFLLPLLLKDGTKGNNTRFCEAKLILLSSAFQLSPSDYSIRASRNLGTIMTTLQPLG